MATMRQVAAHAGVSLKTVSRVLNHDQHVTDGVRQRVMASVADLQYVPNMLAVSFRTGRDSAIGVGVPDIGDPFFASLVQAVEADASARGTAVIVTSLGYDPDRERPALEALLKRQVVGLIACPVAADQSYLRPWQDRTTMVFVDRAPTNLDGVDAVIEDDLGGAREATRHLLGHGHERIAFLGDADRSTTTSLRLQGYTRALHDGGIAMDEELVQLSEIRPAAVRAAVECLRSLADPPTALLSSNARYTLNLIPVLQQTGWKVAAVSFGDFPMAASLDPPMTVIDQNPQVVGHHAAERLFARIDHPQHRPGLRTVLPVSLVERTSCSVMGP